MKITETNDYYLPGVRIKKKEYTDDNIIILSSLSDEKDQEKEKNKNKFFMLKKNKDSHKGNAIDISA